MSIIRWDWNIGSSTLRYNGSHTFIPCNPQQSHNAFDKYGFVELWWEIVQIHSTHAAIITGGRNVTDCGVFFFEGFCKTNDEPPRSCCMRRRRPQTLSRILWGELSFGVDAFACGKPFLGIRKDENLMIRKDSFYLNLFEGKLNQ